MIHLMSQQTDYLSGLGIQIFRVDLNLFCGIFVISQNIFLQIRTAYCDPRIQSQVSPFDIGDHLQQLYLLRSSQHSIVLRFQVLQLLYVGIQGIRICIHSSV